MEKVLWTSGLPLQACLAQTSNPEFHFLLDFNFLFHWQVTYLLLAMDSVCNIIAPLIHSNVTKKSSSLIVEETKPGRLRAFAMVTQQTQGEIEASMQF